MLAAFCAFLYLALSVIALCFPEPQGPGDNGDFWRNMSVFSSGPAGLPPKGTPGWDQMRYFRHHHRYWSLEAPPGAGMHASSRLLSVPGRLLAGREFDLTLNTFVLLVLLSIGAFLAFRRVVPVIGFFLPLAVALIFSDAGAASYLNSFYQESSGYFFLLLFLFAYIVLVVAPSRIAAGCAAVAGLLLLTAKMQYVPSVGLLLVLLALIVIARQPWPRTRRLTAGVAAVLIVTMATLFAARALSRIRAHAAVYAYQTIFGRLLPRIPEEKRGRFLEDIGLPRDLASLSGTNPWNAPGRFHEPEVQGALNGRVHSRAVRAFVRAYPRETLRLMWWVVSHSGKYDLSTVGYRSRDFSLHRQGIGSYNLWTRFRQSIPAPVWYGLGGAGICALLLLARGEPRSIATSFGLASAALFVTSLSQVPIVALGDAGNPVKQLYLANLFGDAQVLFTLSGLLLLASRRIHDMREANVP